MQEHQLVFIGGLHKSGTSLLYRCLRDHPHVSAFHGTGVPEDEGQHLQSVYPPAKAYGGPGLFGFNNAAALDEKSPLVTPENRDRLWSEWGAHWDLSRRVLLEKSPPNLIRGRFLHALFPGAAFIMILRHPVAVAYATRKWKPLPVARLIDHWLVCHERYRQDRPRLERLLEIRYEDLVRQPEPTLRKVYDFIGVHDQPLQQAVRADADDPYFARWHTDTEGSTARFRRRLLILTRERKIRRFGYSLRRVPNPGL
jgi:hypothetical protein